MHSEFAIKWRVSEHIAVRLLLTECNVMRDTIHCSLSSNLSEHNDVENEQNVLLYTVCYEMSGHHEVEWSSRTDTKQSIPIESIENNKFRPFALKQFVLKKVSLSTWSCTEQRLSHRICSESEDTVTAYPETDRIAPSSPRHRHWRSLNRFPFPFAFAPRSWRCPLDSSKKQTAIGMVIDWFIPNSKGIGIGIDSVIGNSKISSESFKFLWFYNAIICTVT